MSLSVAIVGLPNAGKSTLFNALLGRSIANTAPYPFCTIEPNTGVVPVPDERLDELYKMVKKDKKEEIKKVAAVVTFIDIAGLVKGAHRGEGLGNQFLAHIRETDCICFVLRDFQDPEVVQTGVNPKSDLETLQSELILKDLETVEKAQSSKLKALPSRQAGQSQNLKIKTDNLLDKLVQSFNKDMMASQINLDDEEKELIKPLCLLTYKPYFIVLNVRENDLVEIKNRIKQYPDWTVVPICAKLEEQLAGLAPEEQKEYLKSIGLTKSGLERLIKSAYKHLGLISFFTTTGGKETRAWTIPAGTPAVRASGVIHSDFEKHFIKAKVMDYADFVKIGGWQKAKEVGKVRLEGKDYEIKEGEVVEFEVSC